MATTTQPRRYDAADLLGLFLEILEPLLAPVAEALVELVLFLLARRQPAAPAGEGPSAPQAEAMPSAEPVAEAPAVEVLPIVTKAEPAAQVLAEVPAPMPAETRRADRTPTQPTAPNALPVSPRTEPAKEPALFVKLNGRFRPAPTGHHGPTFRQEARGGKRRYVRV